MTFQVHKTLCFTIWYKLGNQGKNEHANASFLYLASHEALLFIFLVEFFEIMPT